MRAQCVRCSSPAVWAVRDIVIEEEYDPLEVANQNIRYSQSRLNRRDPMKLELRKHADEAAMLPGSQASHAASAKHKCAALAAPAAACQTTTSPPEPALSDPPVARDCVAPATTTNSH